MGDVFLFPTLRRRQKQTGADGRFFRKNKCIKKYDRKKQAQNVKKRAVITQSIHSLSTKERRLSTESTGNYPQIEGCYPQIGKNAPAETGEFTGNIACN